MSSHPPRRSLTEQMTAFSERLSKSFRHDVQSIDRADAAPLIDKNSTDIEQPPRSRSRGRQFDEFQSSGRGGLGNIHRSSSSRDARPTDGPDDFSQTRGRELDVHPTGLYSTGRGGAGNIRSPSGARDVNTDHLSSENALTAAEKDDEYERSVLRHHRDEDAQLPHSSGRGGAGNISRSRSRSRPQSLSRGPVHSTGIGGAGNMHTGDGSDTLRVDDEERFRSRKTEGIHSTGRGGAGNIMHTPSPGIESHPHPAAFSPGHDSQSQLESFGRGGAGNIRSREASREANREPYVPGFGLVYPHSDPHHLENDPLDPHPHTHPHPYSHMHQSSPRSGPGSGPASGAGTPFGSRYGLSMLDPHRDPHHLDNDPLDPHHGKHGHGHASSGHASAHGEIGTDHDHEQGGRTHSKHGLAALWDRVHHHGTHSPKAAEQAAAAEKAGDDPTPPPVSFVAPEA